MKSSKVAELLEKINQVLQNANPESLSELEFDILKENIQNLYSALNESRTQAKPAKTDKREVALNTESVENTKLTSVITFPAATENTAADTKIGETISSPKAKNSTSTVNELAKHISSLNEKHKAVFDEVHKKLSSKPLKDLIDLNKKFVLQNELFKGNSNAFTSAVQQLDTALEYSEAEKLLLQFRQEFNWDSASQSARLFSKLVKQKFGA